MGEASLVAAGRTVPHALDRIRRYCGLPWSGGPPETWAWPFYDGVSPGDPDHVGRVDVLAAASLHPGLARRDLAFFHEQAQQVDRWLTVVPNGLALADAPDDVLEHLITLPAALPDVPLTLLTKVLHRKRPQLIPLLDRHVIDWYRLVTGHRSASDAFAPLITELREDSAGARGDQFLASALDTVDRELGVGHPRVSRPRLSWIRAIDIAIWMGSR